VLKQYLEVAWYREYEISPPGQFSYIFMLANEENVNKMAHDNKINFFIIL
jgi:hypothetical protein